MNSSSEQPIIVNLPLKEYNSRSFHDELQQPGAHFLGPIEDSGVSRYMIDHYLQSYPTVYVVHAEDSDEHTAKHKYLVYVGETNDIVRRTKQHLSTDSKRHEKWSRLLKNHPDQYVIAHPEFNKSLTLDIENQFMLYLSSVDGVRENLTNGRLNPQNDYYTRKDFGKIFSSIWAELSREDSELFPPEQIIRDSALFKASPFHRLSREQLEAEQEILDKITATLQKASEIGNDIPQLILAQGAAGTGKTVLLSHLFYRLLTENGVGDAPVFDDEHDERPIGADIIDHELQAYILVNHKEQIHTYNQIATKLGLQKRNGEIVMNATQFYNKFSERDAHGRGIQGKPKGCADVVLVDEAHLLLTQGDQGYSGKNQLYDLLQRARVVVAVFDPAQILQSSQRIDEGTLNELGISGGALESGKEKLNGEKPEAGKTYRTTLSLQDGLSSQQTDVSHITLTRQFRIDASPEIVQWLDDFVSRGVIGQIPSDSGERPQGFDVADGTGEFEDGAVPSDGESRSVFTPYEIRVFDSPIALFNAIKEKAETQPDGRDGRGLSRVLATYDWRYVGKKGNPGGVGRHWNVELHLGGDGIWKMGLGGLNPNDSDNRDRCFCRPWNYQLDDLDASHRSINKDLAWAEKPYTIDEVGSTFTIQGFDLNFAGVIIGPSVQYREGQVVFCPANSKNTRATNRREGFGDIARSNLRNELNVLLKRGVHGLYLFAVDWPLQQRLMEMYRGRR